MRRDTRDFGMNTDMAAHNRSTTSWHKLPFNSRLLESEVPQPKGPSYLGDLMGLCRQENT